MTSSIDKTPDNVPDPELLKAMEFVAKMKASADKVGASFIGGFITDDGRRFVQTNLDDPEEVERRLPPELKWRFKHTSLSKRRTSLVIAETIPRRNVLVQLNPTFKSSKRSMSKANDHYIDCRDKVLATLRHYQKITNHSDAMVVSMLMDITERNFLDGQAKIKIQLRKESVRI